ncbi:MAG: methylornithine synthase PylB [Desulfobacteraceae bacterium 4572_123]|nr:MAG: methylornithine synthase PylB [Desulfobacteraceae bacterium 4572_123]
MKPDNSKLKTIIDKAEDGRFLSKTEITFLLGLKAPEDVGVLFKTARNLRKRFFGDKIFLYGFLYISTYCRNNCRFCYYRNSNSDSLRYRKSADEIIDAACHLADSGVHLIDLTMGEDPHFFHRGKPGFNELSELVAAVKAKTGLPVMISPGVIPDHAMEELGRADVDWFACYQETHSIALFKKLRIGQSYEDRLNTKYLAHGSGILTEEGLLCGIGESDSDVADSFAAIRDLDVDQTRVMNFVPQQGTPLEGTLPPDPMREFMIMAVMRLLFPDRCIPASLDVDGLDGLKQRLDAGANVVTSLVPPGQGLAGVAQNSLDIEDARRTMSGVLPILAKNGLQPASRKEYTDWVRQRREIVIHHYARKEHSCCA